MVTTRGKRIDYAALAGLDDDDDVDMEKPSDREPKARRPPSKKRKSKHTESDDEFGTEGSAPKAAKGKAKRRSSGKARATVLDGFMLIPLDIFAELCSELTPLDLLQLGRSTHRLREILMSKDSKAIWKRSRANVPDLPDCPEDLSEPQYASLMFEVGCQVCDKGTRKTEYQLRVRLCNACLDTRLLTHKQMVGLWKKLPWEVYEYTPHSWFGNKRLGLKDVFLQVKSELVDVEGNLKKDLLEHTIQGLQKLSRMLYETGSAMARWKAEQAQSQQMEKLVLSEGREAKVIEKLIEEGWERQDMPSASPEWDALAYKPIPLTDAIWRRIHSKLIPIVERSRAARLARERQERRMNRMDDFYEFYLLHVQELIDQNPTNLSRGHFLSAANLLSRVPELQKELDDQDEPHYPRAEFEKHIPAVGRVNLAFRENALRLLLAVVERGAGAGLDMVVKKEERSMEPEDSDAPPPPPQAGPSSAIFPGDLSSLTKMTTVFKCTNCQERSWYPDVLQHACCKGKIDSAVYQYFDTYAWDDDDDDDDEDGMFDDMFHVLSMFQSRFRKNRSSEPFSVENLIVDDAEWGKMVKRALRDVGIAENATVQEVMAEGPQFTSLLCSDGALRNDGWSFREVIEHNCMRHKTPQDQSEPVIKRDQPIVGEQAANTA